MIWHIFKKDCRLLWPFVAAVAALHAICASLWISMGHFPQNGRTGLLAIYLPMIAMLAQAVLVAVAIHQDVIPGTTQDWLVRPIRRRDLLMAKFLFVILLVHGSIFIISFSEALVDHMSFAASLHLASSFSVSKFCLISLPAFALGAVTRNLTEAFVAAIALVVGFFAIMMLASFGRALPPTLAGTGEAWMMIAATIVLIFVVAGLVLTLQYFKRATPSSRVAIVIGTLALMFANFIPWKFGFATQEWFASQPGFGKSIALQFESTLGRKQKPQGAIDSSAEKDGRTVSIFLPLRIDGLPKNSLLMLDRGEFRLVSANGTTIFENTTHVSLDGAGRVSQARFVVRQENDAQDARVYQTIFIPIKTYAAFKNQSLRMEVDYSFTLMKLNRESKMPALNGELRTENGMSCKSRIDADDDEIQLGCLLAMKRPSCASITLLHEPSGKSNPTVEGCAPYYAPYHFNFGADAVGRSGVSLPFLDKNELVHYPVDGSKLAESVLVINTYDARDHFTRQLVIPEIRLSDWEAETQTTAIR